MEENGVKSHPEEGKKTSERDGGELVMNHQDSQQERTGESNDGHARNVEDRGRVQDGGEENQDKGDKDEAVQNKLDKDNHLQDRQTNLAGVNAPIPVGQSQVGIRQTNPSNEAAVQYPDSNAVKSETAALIQQVPGVAAASPNRQFPGAIPNNQFLGVPPGAVSQNTLGQVPLTGGVNQNSLGQVPLTGGVNQNTLGQIPLPGVQPGGVNQNTLGQAQLPGPGPAQPAGAVAVEENMTLPRNQNQAGQVRERRGRGTHQLR